MGESPASFDQGGDPAFPLTGRGGGGHIALLFSPLRTTMRQHQLCCGERAFPQGDLLLQQTERKRREAEVEVEDAAVCG